MAEVPLQLARKFLDFYEDYFGIKYPLPKLDLIAIPDFSAILRSGLAGYEPTLDKAVRMFHDHMKNKAIRDPPLLRSNTNTW